MNMSTDVARHFEEHRGRVYRWAYALCGRHEDALDAVQEVFLRMLKNPPELPGPFAVIGWLRRVTSSVVIDRWRRASGAAALPDEQPAADSAAESPEARETAEQLRRAIASLSEQQRQVLLAKMYDRLSFAEIADELGIAISTAKTHYLRALNMVRAHLKIDLSVGSKP
jgi:RNA polymerase sigma-70 factor, ECF subfamily